MSRVGLRNTSAFMTAEPTFRFRPEVLIGPIGNVSFPLIADISGEAGIVLIAQW